MCLIRVGLSVIQTCERLKRMCVYLFADLSEEGFFFFFFNGVCMPFGRVLLKAPFGNPLCVWYFDRNAQPALSYIFFLSLKGSDSNDNEDNHSKTSDDDNRLTCLPHQRLVHRGKGLSWILARLSQVGENCVQRSPNFFLSERKTNNGWVG